MNLKELTKPFPENEIEWRIGQAGKKGNGQIWATCLAYVSARSVMQRLDEVCGPENWKAEYVLTGGPGVICRLSVKCGGEWVTKEDGAEQTDIEAFKGGLSSALKRAGSVWGIGRYLYGLERAYVNVVDSSVGIYAKSKSKTGEFFEFYWEPPALPQWALPDGCTSNALPQVRPDQPKENDGILGDAKPKARVTPKKPAVAPKASDPERTKLVTALLGAYTEYMKEFPEIQMSSLMKNKYGVDHSDLLTKDQMADLAFYMNSAVAESRS